MAHKYEIRALTLGELLDEAFALLSGALGRLVAFQLVVFIPTAIIEWLLIGFIGAEAGRRLAAGGEGVMAEPLLLVASGALAILAIQTVIAPVVGVALTRAVSDTYLGVPWTVWGLIARAPEWLARALGLGLIMLVLFFLVMGVPAAIGAATIRLALSAGWVDGVGTALLALVVALIAGFPALAALVWVNLRFALGFNALAVEDTSVVESLRRSAALMRGRYWSALGLWIVLALVGLLLGFAVTMLVPFPSFELLDSDRIRQLIPALVDAQRLSTLAGEAVGMVTRAYAVIAWTLFYFSARCEREGFDLALLGARRGDGLDAASVGRVAARDALIGARGAEDNANGGP